MSATLTRIGRLVRKPPGYLVRRALTEVRHELDRFVVPARGRNFDEREFLRVMQANSIEEVWEQLRARKPWPVSVSPDAYASVCPGDQERILRAAEEAREHRIDLLGSGPVSLGAQIDWHRDYKTGDRWPLGYFRSIDYVNRGRASDVKTVWELSRMQWLIPAAQAYLLTGDERYASAVRDVIDSWVAANPYAGSVNWGVTMEPAMRIFSWTWFFHVFAGSKTWADKAFRSRFLRSLYLHAEFTERFIERSDVNGNHFTADAAALVVAGVFFAPARSAGRWFDNGCRDLETEILLQVFPDGVDYEASVPYHRLVAELFLHASIWAELAGAPFSASYRERLRAMGCFTAAYTRPNGSTPLWGDADDARTLPFGPQSITDHRYLPALIGLHLKDERLTRAGGGSKAEAFWTFGMTAAQGVPDTADGAASQAFADGGFFVMRNAKDHVFIDCGPLGLAGRGGHGHNDLMSFEAMLDGELLVVDSGCYLYTASFEERNNFRSTAYHNTPQVDGNEVNRFISPDFLWNLHDDARPEVREWRASPEKDRIVMSHSGYERLANGVRPIRTIELEHAAHRLLIEDRFDGVGEREVKVPLQFAPGSAIADEGRGSAVVTTNGKKFRITWNSADWTCKIANGRVAPSYGVVVGAARLEWSRVGPLATLSVKIERCS